MSYISNQAYIRGNSHSISKIGMEKIIDQMNKSICKIYYNNIFGTGFFCNIPISEQNQNPNYFLGLITCNHVIKKKIKGSTIIIIINEITYPLLIDETRQVFADEMRDIIIIEIRKDELLNINYLYLDENIFNTNPENIYEDIYILHFEFGKDAKYSNGIINSIDKTLISNKKIFYSCETQPGSSGGPIINSRNYKVIGIHKGFDKNKGLNTGLFIGDAIIEFQKHFRNISNSNNQDNKVNINYNNINFYNNLNNKGGYNNIKNIF